MDDALACLELNCLLNPGSLQHHLGNFARFWVHSLLISRGLLVYHYQASSKDPGETQKWGSPVAVRIDLKRIPDIMRN